MQTDMSWIARAEGKVLDNFIAHWTADSLTGSGLTWRGHSASNINPCGHGALRPLLAMAIRHGRHEILEWIAVHIEDFLACYWSCKLSSGKPPGEGCRLVEGKLINYDADILRHAHAHGILRAAIELHERESLSDAVFDEVKAMAKDWGAWLLRSFIRNGELIREREYLRAGIPLQDLVAIGEITNEPHWAALAETHFWRYWGPHYIRRVDGDFHTFDSGWPWEPRGGYMGHITMWPWYHGEMIEGFLDFYPVASEAAQAHMRWVAVELSEWYALRQETPMIHPQVLADTHNCPLQGGYISGDPASMPWIRKSQPILDGPNWDALSDGVPYKPLCIMEWHEWWGHYLSKTCTDPAGNEWQFDHHQDRVPRLYRGSGWGIPTLLKVRSWITGDQDDKLLAAWATHDYCGYANHVSVQDVVKKTDVNDDWTSGAQGRGRGGQWLLRAGWRFRCPG